MIEEMTEEDLEKLKEEKIERATFEDVFGDSIFDEFSNLEDEQIVEKANDYLEKFISPKIRKVNPDGLYACINCSSILAGFDEGFGVFEWGLEFAKGHCGECKYPMRGRHSIKFGEDENGTDLTYKFSVILQYHPSEVEHVEK